MSTEKSNKNNTECVCPKCGIKHLMKLFWTGRGKPKKFCPDHALLSHEEIEPSEIPIDCNNLPDPNFPEIIYND